MTTQALLIVRADVPDEADRDYLDPVAVREGVVGQGLRDVRVDELRRAPHTLAAELVDDRRALASAVARVSWAWIALSMWLTSRSLRAGTSLKTLR